MFALGRVKDLSAHLYLFHEYRVFSSGGNAVWWLTLTTYFHLVPSLRMSGFVPPLPCFPTGKTLHHNTFQHFFFGRFVQKFSSSYICRQRLHFVSSFMIFSLLLHLTLSRVDKRKTHCRLVHLLECTRDAMRWNDGVFPLYCIPPLLYRQRNQWRKKKIDAIYVRMGHKNEPIFPLGRQNRERQLRVPTPSLSLPAFWSCT
jgi:hypothetical protein